MKIQKIFYLQLGFDQTVSKDASTDSTVRVAKLKSQKILENLRNPQKILYNTRKTQKIVGSLRKFQKLLGNQRKS